MNDPSSPIGWHVWRRGARLGLQWLVVFFAATLVLYLLLGVIGWSGVAQALCAMFAGPVIGASLIAAWWFARRPALLDDPTVGGTDESMSAEDE